MSNNSVGKKFLGYRMVVVCFIIAMAVLGMGYSPMTMYMPVLCQEMNLSMAAISVMFSCMTGGSVIASFVSGTISQKIGMKKLVLLGVFSLLLGYVVLYFSTSVFMLYAGGILVGVSLSWAGVICVGRIIPAWFIEKRGTMLGIVMSAAGVGGVIASPMISALMKAFDWRMAFLVTMIIMAAIAIPSALLIVETPQKVGQMPLGADKIDNTGSKAAVLYGPTAATARKSAAFGTLFLLWIPVALVNSGFNSQYSNALVSKGIDMTTVGVVVSVASAANLVGNIVLGMLNDKFGLKSGLAFVLGSAAVSLVILAFTANTASAIAFGILYGFGMPMGGNVLTLVAAKTFGSRAYPSLMGTVNGVKSGIGMFASILLGFAYDRLQSYTVICLVLAVLLVIGFISALAAFKQGEKLPNEE